MQIKNATVDTLTTTTEQDDYPASNLCNDNTALKWKGDADSPLDDEYITVDVSDYVDEIDYFAVAGHNFGTAQATASAVQVRLADLGLAAAEAAGRPVRVRVNGADSADAVALPP